MKYAICIGLNYKGTRFELPDCLLDAQRLAACAHSYDQVLVFDQINFAQMQTAVAAMRLKKTDTLFLAYSGHGTQIPNQKEADGYDEALVLYDGKYVQYLPDDVFQAWLNTLPCKLVVVLDACYSGGMSRGVQSPLVRFTHYEPGPEIVTDEINRAIQMRMVQIYACSEDETAKSTGNGGECTNALLAAMADGRVYCNTIFEYAKAKMKGQTPVLYAPLSTAKVKMI